MSTKNFYCELSPARVNPEALRQEEELYRAGREWGKAGNLKIPRYYPYDRGDGSSVLIPIVGSTGYAAGEFVKGWKETRPVVAKKGKGKGKK